MELQTRSSHFLRVLDAMVQAEAENAITFNMVIDGKAKEPGFCLGKKDRIHKSMLRAKEEAAHR